MLRFVLSQGNEKSKWVEKGERLTTLTTLTHSRLRASADTGDTPKTEKFE